MAGKRSATSELNHDNWNDDEKPEEAGTFSKASEDVLQKRVIKSARRRIANSGDGAPKAAFGSFTGFKPTPTTASTSPFSFLTNSNTKLSGEMLSSSVSASNGSTSVPANGSDIKDGPSKLETGLKNTEVKNQTSVAKDDGKILKKSTDYHAKLKGLNESVTQWIKSHVDSNPFCILTPIFKDYEKYLEEIEAKHGQEKNVAIDVREKLGQKTVQEESSSPAKKKQNLSSGSTETQQEKSVFGSQTAAGNTETKTGPIFGNVNTGKSIFGNTEQVTEFKSIFGNVSSEIFNPFLNESLPAGDDKKKESTSDNNDQKSTPSLSFPQSGSTATFSFGQSSATSTASAQFSFGGGKPFSFENVNKSGDAVEAKEDEDKDEDDEPPKVEFKPVTEEGAIYEKRCKVFVKKDGNFSDRGVGTLFLKPTPNEKTQLIVRADTSCGNLLLNTILNEGIPTQRMGKNNVMMVLLPTPDSKPPPTPILLRVKTSEDADALLEVLNKHKK